MEMLCGNLFFYDNRQLNPGAATVQNRTQTLNNRKINITKVSKKEKTNK